MEQELCPVYGYDGRYVMNRQGEVFCLWCNWTNAKTGEKKIIQYPVPRLMSVWVADVGYKRVQLTGIGRKRAIPVSVHSLLFQTFVRPLAEGEEIDHINRDRLDNRIENLRAVTRTQNCANMSRRKNKEYKGVSKNSLGNTWQANIGNTVDGVSKPIYLGCFDSPVKAAVAYDLAAIKKFETHANTNFIKIADSLETA